MVAVNSPQKHSQGGLTSGLGRTGVLVACFLVYSLRVRANDAIRLVRRRRPRSVQTSGQILCVQQFEHYLLPQTVVFSSKDNLMLTKEKKTAEFTLRQYLYRQRATLHGLDERAFKELPKVNKWLPKFPRVRSRPFYKSFLSYKLRRTRPPDPTTPVEADDTEHVCTLPTLEWRDSVEEDIERNLETVSRITGGSTNNGTIPALHVYEAFVVDHNSLPEERQKYLKQLRTDINLRADAVNKIEDEEDPTMISGLLFEWLESLKAPVLSRDDLSLIVGHAQSVESCVLMMDNEDIMLVEYLLRFVTRLRPLAANKKVDMLKRLLAALTHQTVSIGGKCLPTRRDIQRLRDGTCNQVINFFLRLIVDIQKDMVKPGRDDTDVVVMPMQPRRYKIKAWK
ncbi:hypothetical protein NE865_08975 [Phthorimaea operculella]|nr:hypothetical protein NE865_08975 [Phthorimaea operculella]